MTITRKTQSSAMSVVGWPPSTQHNTIDSRGKMLLLLMMGGGGEGAAAAAVYPQDRHESQKLCNNVC